MGVNLMYIAGVYFGIGVDFTDSVRIPFGAGLSTFLINFDDQFKTIQFNFNFIAFIIIYWINLQKKQDQLEAELIKTNSIGAIEKEDSV